MSMLAMTIANHYFISQCQYIGFAYWTGDFFQIGRLWVYYSWPDRVLIMSIGLAATTRARVGINGVIIYYYY